MYEIARLNGWRMNVQRLNTIYCSYMPNNVTVFNSVHEAKKRLLERCIA